MAHYSSAMTAISSSLESRVTALEAQLQFAQRRARRWKVALGSVVAGGLVLGGAQALAGPTSPLACDPLYTTSIYCFTSDTPALASQVNSNFQAVIDLLEAKVGAPIATAEADPTTVSGIVAVGLTTGKNVAIDSDEILARNGNVGSTLLIQDGAGAGNTQLNANAGQVLIGNASLAANSTRLKAYGTSDLTALVVGGGDRIGRMEVGLAGTCAPNSIGPGPTKVNFKAAFPTAPFVFTQPVEPDQNGCTSMRVQSVTTTDFTFQSWTGSTAAPCDCLYYFAVSLVP